MVLGGVQMRKVILTMKARHKYEVIKQVVNGRKPHQRAAIDLGLSNRQIDRLINVYRAEGAAGFQHGNTGKRPKNRISDELKKQIIKLYRTKYDGLNIRHFHEKLGEQESITISESSLRHIFRDHHVLSPKSHHTTIVAVRRELKEIQKVHLLSKPDQATYDQIELVDPLKAHPSRARKKLPGELIQMDASQEIWFGRQKTTLHAAIDDCTGKIVGAHFDKQETLNGYYQVMAQILSDYGAPYEILTDRRTVFESTKKASASNEDPLTRFGYACKTLGTQLSVTSIPQTKGRIERLFETLQDRLINELKLNQVKTINQANRFLKSYLSKFNQQFSSSYKGTMSAFDTQLTATEIDQILIIANERKVSVGHTIKLHNLTYQTYDQNELVCLKPHTKVLTIETFSGALFATDDRDQIYELRLLPIHESWSRAFDLIPKKKKTPQSRRPEMTHPWRRQNYRDYLISIGVPEARAVKMAYRNNYTHV